MKKYIFVFLMLLYFVSYGQDSFILRFAGVPRTYLNVIQDGNTVGWYKFDEASTITKDGSNYVAQWNDFLGSARILYQSTLANKPLWTADGISFDGTNDWMNATFTYAQPEEIYLVFKQVAHTTYDVIFDGSTVLKGQLAMGSSSLGLIAYGGTSYSTEATLTTGVFNIIRVVFNGASSKLQVNTSTAVTGSWGTAAMGGITIGNATYCPQYILKEMILRKVADNTTDEGLIYDYLKAKYGL